MNNELKFTTDWFSYYIPLWTELFKDACPLYIFNILEIGTYEGRSCLWFCENLLKHPLAKITCVDTFLGGDEHTDEEKTGIYDRFLNNINGYKDKIIIKKGESNIELKKLEYDSYDIIYIDGSHLSRDVLEDAILSFRLVKQNGIMIFDDYLWRDITDLQNPKIGIDCFLQAYKGSYTILHVGYQLIIKKI